MGTSALAQAAAALQRGELDVAEQALQQILALDPHMPQALHLLGVVACRRGDQAKGKALIEQAFERLGIVWYRDIGIGLERA